MEKQRILIMAGGTGGHVFPGLAVAKRARAMGFEVLWLGTHQGLEADIVPKSGIPIRFLSITGVRRTTLKTRLLSPFRLLYALYQALRIIHQFKPDVVLGMGGFVTGPGGLAAFLLRRPIVIHEQNAIAGFTNRILARFAKRVLEGFPNSFPKSVSAIWTGNPVREEFSLVIPPSQRFSERFKEKDFKGSDSLRLLILGGSQGALALNELVPKALHALREFTPQASLEIWHQTGNHHLQHTEQLYQNLKVSARIEPFIQDMATAYAWADLVICRAGALTISELAMVGVGSILIPFPFAVDDHQTHNGRFLEKVGAACIVPQALLKPKDLAEKLQRFLHDKETLVKMAVLARELAKPEALTTVISQCIEVCREFKSKNS